MQIWEASRPSILRLDVDPDSAVGEGDSPDQGGVSVPGKGDAKTEVRPARPAGDKFPDAFEGSVPTKQIDDQVPIFSSRNADQMMSVAAHYYGMSVPARRKLRKTIKLSVLTAHKMLTLGIDWYFHHVSP